MHSFKSKMTDIVTFIDEVRLPCWPKRVNRADTLIFSKSHGDNPILTTLQNDHNSPQAFRVDVKWTNGALSSNQRPLCMSLGLRNLEERVIGGWNAR